MYWDQPVSMGGRIAMEVKLEVGKGILHKVVA
ncbi:DUF1297 domain-containing protein [Desulfurococcus mucosus]